MELKPHTRDTYTDPDQTSRMAQDFLEYSENLLPRTHPLHAVNFTPGMKPESEDDWYGRHVGIVGAGFAGLRCAEILLVYGAHVTILEARDRVGGRVHQADLYGYPVDIGPNWIHGTVPTNTLFFLAQKANKILYSIPDLPRIFDRTGQRLADTKVAQIADTMWSMLSDAFRYSNAQYLHILEDASLKTFFKDRLHTIGLSETDKTLVLDMAQLWGGFIGDVWEKQSLRELWLEECLDGENLFVADTHGKILEGLADRVIDHDRVSVHLSTTVAAISNPTGPSTKGNVLVRTTDARDFGFDEIVVTVPLGCLKHGTIEFTPPLSAQMSRAIEKATIGSLEKVCLLFPRAFWTSTSSADTSTSSTSSPSTASSTSSSASSSTPSSSTSTFTSTAPTPNPPDKNPPANQHQKQEEQQTNPYNFTHILRPTQTTELLSYPSSSPILCFTIHSAHTDLINSILSTSTTTTSTSTAPQTIPNPLPLDIEKLTPLLEPHYSHLANYNPSNPSCQPYAGLLTTLKPDKDAGFASYVNFCKPDLNPTHNQNPTLNPAHPQQNKDQNPETKKKEESLLSLRHGLTTRHIWIAGDHASAFVALGTLTGAYWSGESVGVRVLRSWGVDLDFDLGLGLGLGLDVDV